MLSGQGQSTFSNPGKGKHLEECLGRTPAHNNLVEQVCADTGLQQLLNLTHQLSCLCRTAKQVLRGSTDTLVEDPAWLQLMTQLTAQAMTCPARNQGSHTLHDATSVEALNVLGSHSLLTAIIGSFRSFCFEFGQKTVDHFVSFISIGDSQDHTKVSTLLTADQLMARGHSCSFLPQQ